MLTKQPSAPRLLVQSTWIPKASAATRKTSPIIIDPPTLASGIEPVNCRSRMPITAISAMYIMWLSPLPLR
jgi:hypothetical protein